MITRVPTLIALAVGVLAGDMFRVAEAVCPANGHREGILLTFNGLSGFHDILVLDSFGNFVGSMINRTTYDVKKIGEIKMLRCLRENPWDGRLFLCSGAPADSKIIGISAEPSHADCTRDVEFVFTEKDKKVNPLLDHPYDVGFTPTAAMSYLTEADIPSTSSTSSSSWWSSLRLGAQRVRDHAASHGAAVPIAYVANQNAAAITWHRATGSRRGEPLPAPLALIDGGEKHTPEPAAFIVPHAGPGKAAGLRSVRGVAVSPDGSKLVVCDVFSQRLAVFDALTSAFLYHINMPQQPVQVTFASDEFFAEHLSAEVADTAARLTAAGSKETDSDLTVPGFGHQMMVITTKSPAMYWAALKPRAIPDLFSLVRTRANSEHNTNLAGVSAAPKLGLFYVIDRLGRRLARIRYDGFALDGYDSAVSVKHISKFGPSFLDHPEFVLHVDNVGPKVTKPCYELGPYGPRVSMLCVGVGFFVCAAALVSALILFDLVRRRYVMPYLAGKYRKRHPSMAGSSTDSDSDRATTTRNERTPLVPKKN